MQDHARHQVERRVVNEILIPGHPLHVRGRHEREGVLGRIVAKCAGWQSPVAVTRKSPQRAIP